MLRVSTATAGLRPWLVVGVLALALAAPARGDEAYYLMVFGSQQEPPRAKYSHSFATFVKATGQGGCIETWSLEAHTISWLPQNLDVRVYALLPECGHNFDLHTTVRYALSNHERVSVWGPYPIDRELYCRALRQIGHLESGAVQYKAVDTGYPTSRVSNCIHAVSDIAETTRLRVASPGWGETASYYITRELEPWILDCSRTHDWVFFRLGLGQYPIIHRALRNPRSGVFNSLLGRAVIITEEMRSGPH